MDLSPEERKIAEAEIHVAGLEGKIPLGMAPGYHTPDLFPCAPLRNEEINVDCFGNLTLCCHLSGHGAGAGSGDVADFLRPLLRNISASASLISVMSTDSQPTPKIQKSEDEWRKQLTPEQYHVARQKGTEPAFTGKYWDNHEDGNYRCACCGALLFDSATKFDSGTGWPSFFAPTDNAAVRTVEDTSHGMRRVEVLCAQCDAHLGHLFPDGPRPTGERFCMNSASLQFEKRASASAAP
jgi:peptide-methionine (R)-S-oxide reductase